MPLPLNARLSVWFVLLVSVLIGPAQAGPPAPAPPTPTASAAPRAIPDYGGREGGLSGTLNANDGAQPPLNPLAQAGRAFEALVVVLACVVGGLYLLKRSGLIKGDGTASLTGGFGRGVRQAVPRLGSSPTTSAAATDLLTLLGSQILPHSPGAALHLISVGGRSLLLGATSHSVTLLADLDQILGEAAVPETPAEASAFADYLDRVGVSDSPNTSSIRAAEATLSAANERLQSLLARRQEETAGK